MTDDIAKSALAIIADVRRAIGDAEVSLANAREQLRPDELVDRIRVMVNLGDQYAELGQQARRRADVYYRNAGWYLRALKTNKPKPIAWPTYLKQQGIALSQQRADELIRIATGATTVEESRERNKQKNRRARQRKQADTKKSRSRDSDKQADTKKPAPRGASTANAFIRDLLSFLESFATRLGNCDKAGWSQEDRDALAHNLHQCANELTVLTQSLNDGGLQWPDSTQRPTAQNIH
jgi:hypothetical protein